MNIRYCDTPRDTTGYPARDYQKRAFNKALLYFQNPSNPSNNSYYYEKNSVRMTLAPYPSMFDTIFEMTREDGTKGYLCEFGTKLKDCHTIDLSNCDLISGQNFSVLKGCPVVNSSNLTTIKCDSQEPKSETLEQNFSVLKGYPVINSSILKGCSVVNSSVLKGCPVVNSSNLTMIKCDSEEPKSEILNENQITLTINYGKKHYQIVVEKNIVGQNLIIDFVKQCLNPNIYDNNIKSAKLICLGNDYYVIDYYETNPLNLLIDLNNKKNLNFNYIPTYDQS